MACCYESSCSSAARSDALNSPKWRRALWIALFINAGFFVAEIVAGFAGGSAALHPMRMLSVVGRSQFVPAGNATDQVR